MTLTLVSTALFGITFLLFRSFQGHRRDLAREWSGRGRNSLSNGRPADAVKDFRAALSYEPDDRIDQLQLAQALAASGRTEEAISYFLSLWEARPGEGFVNLQLARLTRKRGNAPEATNYYRAAIFGTWEGDGTERRREIRLELADYLAERGDIAAARSEILIAVGNAPAEETLQSMFADKLQAIGDESDALSLYQKALDHDPTNRMLLEKAGRISYDQGHFEEARTLLKRALSAADGKNVDAKTGETTYKLLQNILRLQELQLSADLTDDEQTDHILLDSQIAQRRLRDCAQLTESGGKVFPTPPNSKTSDPTLLTIEARWSDLSKQLNAKAVRQDPAVRSLVVPLIYDTETQTVQECGAPVGDDALLLIMARLAHQGSR